MASADSYDRSNGVKTAPVYTRVTDPDRYLRGNNTIQQEMRNSDAAGKLMNDRYGGPINVPTINSPEVITAADAALAAQNAFTNAATGLGGSGGSGGSKFDINMAKLNEDKRQYNESRADAKAKFDALKNYYDTGGYKTGFDELNNIATGQYNTGVQGLQGTYDRAQENLGAGYDMAQGLTDQGYTALQNYLQQNPNNAYEGLMQQVQPVANPMEQFLSAYGVSNQPVQAQVGAEQLAGQQGAGAFNSLADILNRTSQQSNASRMAEMQMGRTMANSGLGAQRANYQAQNAQSQAQALAQLQQQLSNQQFGIQQNQMQAGQDIYQQLLAATGNYGQSAGGGQTSTGLTPEMLQALSARRGM